MHSKTLRQVALKTITFVGGLYFFLEFILPEQIGDFKFGRYHDQISRGVVMVGVMAIGLGLINILRVHGGNIIRGRKNWGNSVALILGLVLTFAIEGNEFVQSETRSSQLKQLSDLELFAARILSDYSKNYDSPKPRLILLKRALEDFKQRTAQEQSFLNTKTLPPLKQAVGEGLVSGLDRIINDVTELESLYDSNTDTERKHEALIIELKNIKPLAYEVAEANYDTNRWKKASNFIQEAFYVPLGSAMFALLAFYVATAAYRTFRVRSLEASLMMITAIIVMLGQIPFGPLYISEDLPALRLWLLQYISTPAFRAIAFGALIASMAMAVRMWLSLERSPLSANDDLETENTGAETR